MRASDPAHWCRVSDAPLDRAMVVLDLDGVISDATHRQWYLRGGRRDFEGFFAAAVDDPLIESGAALAAAIADDHTVVILTARPELIRDDTVAWLARYHVRHDLLILQPAGDGRRSAEFKGDEVAALRERGADIRVAFEDSPENIAALRAAGIATVSVHSGYYEGAPKA